MYEEQEDEAVPILPAVADRAGGRRLFGDHGVFVADPDPAFREQCHQPAGAEPLRRAGGYHRRVGRESAQAHAAGGGGSYSKARTLRPGQVGGNRLPRSQRTEQLDSYIGADRAFILRWLDSGTANRTSRYGNRGAIAARRWFGNASYAALDKASEEFGKLLDELIAKEMNK